MENLSDFDFYLKFTKPLILNLPQINDRVLAAAWVKKLAGDAAAEEKIKLDYLKLLLFVLQRKRLAPPFTQHPNALEKLDKFPEDQTLVDVAKAIIEQEQQERFEKWQKRMKGESGDYPPYVSDFSADLLEYVAVQSIENFGVHCYYAVSKQPLSSWYRTDRQLLPKAAKSMLEVSVPPPTLTETQSTPELIEKSPEKPEGGQPPPEQPPAEQPPAPQEPPPEAEQPSPEKEESPRKKKESPRRSALGATPPSRPIGKVSPPAEDREPPTWGSNLLEVKFLEEEVSDFGEGDLPSGAAPMEILWTPPTGGFGPEMLDEESPFLIGDEDMFLDESMPSFLAGSMTEEGETPPPAWTSAASIPYATPPYPWVTPPPPGKPTPPPPPAVAKKPAKKAPPKIKPTRASLLLQKKKTEAAAPPPPPPATAKKPVARKSSSKIAKRPSKPKAEEPPPPPPQEEAPPKKKVVKKPSKGKVKKPAKKAEESKVVALAQLEGTTGTEPHREFPPDEVEDYVAQYNKMMGEIQEQYQTDMAKYAQMIQSVETEGDDETTVSREPTSKRHLSYVAKYSKLGIPKEHGVPVELEKSIHLSPEARQIYDDIIEGPSTSTGISEAPPSIVKHPTPKLPPGFIEEDEDVEETTEDETTAAMELEGTQATVQPEYATMQTSPGHGTKDPRVVTAYNQALDASMHVADPDYDLEAFAQLGLADGDLGLLDMEELDVDIGNISGVADNLEDLMGDLEGAAVDPDDFEAMERMVEEQTRREGQDPHARKKAKPSRKQFSKGLKRYLDVHARADAQMAMLEDEGAAQPSAADLDDFEAMERMVEEQMRHEGQDPHGRKKAKPSRKQFSKGLKRYLDVHARADMQLAALEDEGAQVLDTIAMPAEPAQEDFEWIPGEQFFEMSQEQVYQRYGTPVDTLRKPMRSVVPLGEVTTDLEVPVKFDRTVSPRPKRASRRGMRKPPTKGRRPLRPVMEEEERSPVPVRDPLEGVEWTSAEQFFEMPDEEVQQRFGAELEFSRKPTRNIVPLGEVTVDLEAPIKLDTTALGRRRPQRVSKMGIIGRPPTKGRRPLRPVMEVDEETGSPLAARYAEAAARQAVAAEAAARQAAAAEATRQALAAAASPMMEAPAVAMDGEDWVPADQFFQLSESERDRRTGYQLDTTPQKPVRAILPEIVITDMDRDEQLIFEDDIPVDDILDDVDAQPSPGTPERAEDVAFLYREIIDADPAFAGVPVTSPKPTSMPLRPAGGPVGPLNQLLAVPDVSPVDYAKLGITLPPDVYGLTQFVVPHVPTGSPQPGPSRLTAVTPAKPRASFLPPSPAKFPEELAPMPSPSQVWAQYPPEAFQLQYTSPEMAREQMKALVPIDEAGLSPRHRQWWSELDELHRRIYGISPGETVPTVFDMPYERVMGESPPKLASPIQLSPSSPIDLKDLRHKIQMGYLKIREPYEGFIGPKQKRIQRYSHREALLSPVEEQHDFLTEEDAVIRSELAHFQPIRERKDTWRFPYKHKNKLMQRHSAGPDLGNIRELYESPEKMGPDVFDLPPVGADFWRESPPQGMIGQLSPLMPPREMEENWDEYKEEIQAQADPSVIHRRLIQRSRRPGLEPVRERLEAFDEDDMEQQYRIAMARGRLPPKQFQTKRATKLPAIGSPVDYPEVSPTTSRPVPESLGREGPMRRTLRKRLKKRRLDFSEPPSSPDETQVEVTDVQTEIGEERDLDAQSMEQYQLAPDLYERWRRARQLSPEEQPEPEGSPRTPVQRVRDFEAPDWQGLPEFSPPTPLSDMSAMEEFVSKVKQSKRRGAMMAPPRKRHRDYYTVRPWAKMRDFEEIPLEEAAARIHEEVEAEVEAELAAAGLPKAKSPEREPFYETPPELKRRPLTPLKSAADPYMKATRAVSPLARVGMMPPRYGGILEEEAFPTTPSPRRPPCIPCGPSPSPSKPSPEMMFLASAARKSPLVAGETPPELFSPGRVPMGSPMRAPQTAEEVQRLADLQYAQLLDDSSVNVLEAEAEPIGAVPEAQMTVLPLDRIKQIEAAQYAALLDTPEGGRAPSPAGLGAIQAIATPSPPRRSGRARSPGGSPFGDMYYQQLISSPELAKGPMQWQPSPEPGPSTVEFEYQETVTEQKDPKKVKSAKVIKAVKGKVAKGAAAAKGPPKPVKGKALAQVKGKALAQVKSDKSVTSVKSSKSGKSAKSDKSDQSIKKPRKKKFNVQSKIDSGRKKKAPPAKPPEPEIVAEAEYDMAALQELGVTEEDLRNLNLNDLEVDVAQLDEEAAVHAHAPHHELERAPVPQHQPPPDEDAGVYYRQRVRPSRLAPRLPAVTETEEEHRPRSPMKFDMRWHLSPKRRVDLRVPDVKVPPEPITESRYKFERVELQLPPEPLYDPLLPMPVNLQQTMRWPHTHDLQHEEIPDVQGLEGVEEPFLVTGGDPYDIFEEDEEGMERVKGTPEDYFLEDEATPAGVYITPKFSPSPIKRRKPIGGPPVSPSQLRGELEAHEYYDPDRKKMKKKIYVRGKFRPLRGAKAPQLGTVHEGTPPPPRRLPPPITQTKKAAADVMAAANLQYDALLSDSPMRKPRTPPTPSPDVLKYRVQRHPYDPLMYKRSWPKYESRSPNLTPPREAIEDLIQPEPERRRIIVTGRDIPLPSVDPELVGSPSPPPYYSPHTPTPPVLEVEERVEVWEAPEFAPDVSPPLYESPEPIQIPPLLRGLMPSPERPSRYVIPERSPLHFQAHGLPSVVDHRFSPRQPTPTKPSVPKAERKLPRRRLDFSEPAQSPRSPVAAAARSPVAARSPKAAAAAMSPVATTVTEHVSVLTVEPEDSWSPQLLSSPGVSLHEELSVLEAVSPQSPHRMASPERSTSPWGMTSQIPEGMSGFRWLDAHVAEDLPWEQE